MQYKILLNHGAHANYYNRFRIKPITELPILWSEFNRGRPVYSDIWQISHGRTAKLLSKTYVKHSAEKDAPPT